MSTLITNSAMSGYEAVRLTAVPTPSGARTTERLVRQEFRAAATPLWISDGGVGFATTVSGAIAMDVPTPRNGLRAGCGEVNA